MTVLGTRLSTSPFQQPIRGSEAPTGARRHCTTCLLAESRMVMVTCGKCGPSIKSCGNPLGKLRVRQARIDPMFFFPEFPGPVWAIQHETIVLDCASPFASWFMKIGGQSIHHVHTHAIACSVEFGVSPNPLSQVPGIWNLRKNRQIRKHGPMSDRLEFPMNGWIVCVCLCVCRPRAHILFIAPRCLVDNRPMSWCRDAGHIFSSTTVLLRYGTFPWGKT